MDLIDERNQQLKSLAMKEWNRKNNIHISNSEWYIMGLIYQSNPTISYVTKNIDITRQAVHKFAKAMKIKMPFYEPYRFLGHSTSYYESE